MYATSRFMPDDIANAFYCNNNRSCSNDKLIFFGNFVAVG